MNKVFLLGRLTRDVELKETSTTSVARVGIAVDRRFSKEKEADFFNLIAFGKTAEFMKKYFEKGTRLCVEGHLRFSQYEDKHGVKRTAVDVIVDTVEFADSKKKAASSGDYREFDSEPVDDEDTPF